MLGDDHLILRGGGCQILYGQNFFFSEGSAGKSIFMCMGSGKFIFVLKHGIATVHCTEAITRNSNVIESSSIRWNY